MTEELYRKVYNLTLECIACWDDFYCNGDSHRIVCWDDTKLSYKTKEFAEIGGKKFVSEMNSLLYDEKNSWRGEKNKLEMMARLSMKEEPTLPAVGFSDFKIEHFSPGVYRFKYYVEEAFEKVDMGVLADESLLGKDWNSEEDRKAWESL